MNTFSTFDLGLATVLVTAGYKLIKLDRNIPGKVRFIFKEEKDIDQVMMDYFNNKIKLPAQSLLNNQKMLKNRIYSDE